MSGSSFSQISFDIKHTISQNFLNPTSVFPVDLDKDGKIDIVAGSKYDSIVWFKNTGDGIYTTPYVICTSLDYIQYVSACDIDNDGDIDILSASQNDSTYAWIENLGNESFSAPHLIFQKAYIPKYISGYDFDNDNDIDIVVTSQNRIMWFENDGNCNFNAPVTIAEVTSETIRIMDYDNDGDNDIFTVAYNNENKVFWFENEGSDTSFIKRNIDIPFNFIELGDIEIYDMNADSNLDVILSFHVSWSNKIVIFLNEGSGFSNYTAMSAGVPHFIIVDDFDNDGDGDILTTTFDRIEYHENINFSFPDKIYFGNIDKLSDMDESDIDADGDMDVICSVKDGQSIYWMENILLEITKQPTDKTVCLYQDTVLFSVEAKDSKHYQWETREVGYSYFYTLENNDIFWDVTTPTLKIIRPDLTIDGQEFRCKVSNYIGFKTSDTAKISIINDSEPPVLITKNAILYLQETSYTELYASQVISDLYDDCGYVDTILSKVYFDCNDIGENIITLTAIDGSGNEISKNVDVNVEDTLAPKAVINAKTVFFTEGTSYKIISSTADPELCYDNCGILSVINNITNTETLKGAELPVGSTTVEWTITDVWGNVFTTSSNVLITNENEYSVYPNPINNYCAIEQQYEGKYDLEIINQSGQAVYSVSNITAKTYYFDLSFLNQGIYIFRIKFGNNITNRKVVKINK